MKYLLFLSSLLSSNIYIQASETSIVPEPYTIIVDGKPIEIRFRKSTQDENEMVAERPGTPSVISLTYSGGVWQPRTKRAATPTEGPTLSKNSPH